MSAVIFEEPDESILTPVSSDTTDSNPEAAAFAECYAADPLLMRYAAQIAIQLGMALLPDGLYLYCVRGKAIAPSLVTRDFERTLTFLGFNAPRAMSEPFVDSEAIYHFVAGSRGFSRTVFQPWATARLQHHMPPGTLPSRAETKAFWVWLTERPEYASRFHFDSMSSWPPIVFKAFPEAQARYQFTARELVDIETRRRERAARYGAVAVMRRTGLPEKQTAAALTAIGGRFAEQGAFHAWMDELTTEAFDAEVRRTAMEQAVTAKAIIARTGLNHPSVARALMLMTQRYPGVPRATYAMEVSLDVFDAEIIELSSLPLQADV